MKHKEKKKHLESSYLKPSKKSREKLNLQEHPLQHEEAGKDSHSSGYLTFISPTNKQSGTDIKTFEECAPQVLAEAPGGGLTEERPCCSKYVSRVSSPSKLPPPDTQGIHRLHQNVFCLGSNGMPVSKSSRKRKNLEGHLGRLYDDACKRHASFPSSCDWREATAQSGLPASTADIKKIQDYAPQSQICVEAPGCGPRKEISPSAHHLTCVSSPSRRFRPNNHGAVVTPVSKNLQQTEISSPSPHASPLFSSFSNNKPCTSLVPGRDERVMTIYYMRVQKKRGRVVLEDPEEEGLEPSPKKMKIEEMTYIEKVFENTPFSQMSRKRPLTDCRPYLDSRAQKKQKVERPASPPALQVYHRAINPEWLGAHNSGFKCMACCSIFPSLEVLKEHVENGFKEGFSCRTFHLTLACLKHKNREEEEKGNQEGKVLDASSKSMLL